MSLQANDHYDATQAVIDMIDINTLHLNGLRTECVLTETLTQKEIRGIETKLIRLFGKQLFERQIALKNKNYNVQSPQLRKWLHIVGLDNSLIESIIRKIGDDFDILLNLNQDELIDLIPDTSNDERRRLLSAMSNLKLFIEKLKVNDTTVNDLDLHWDSWNITNINNNEDNSIYNDDLSENRSSCPSPLDESNRLIINSQEQLDIEISNSNTISKSSSKEFHHRTTSPSAPPFLNSSLINSSSSSSSNHKLPITPPMRNKFKTTTNHNNTNTNRHHNNSNNFDNTVVNFNTSMPKSKSHEGHLTNKINTSSSDLIDVVNYNRPRLVSEPCPDTKLHSHNSSRSPPIASPDNLYNTQSDNCFEEQTSQPPSSTNSSSNVNTPRSPRAQGMLHSIHHLFTNRLKPNTVICNLCEKQMMFGYKCRACKYRCHRECSSKVPPLCGLPSQYFEIFKATINNNRSQISSASSQQWNRAQTTTQQQPTIYKNSNNNNNNNNNKKQSSKLKSHQYVHKRSSPDSSNPSSHNSSAPPSPSPLPIQPLTNNNPTSANATSCSTTTTKFTFNKLDDNNSSLYHHHNNNNQRKNNHLVNPQIENLINNEPVTINQLEEQQYNNQQNDDQDSFDAQNKHIATFRLNSQDSQVDFDQSDDRTWPRQNSLTMAKEWNIPFDEIQLEKEIGTGRFGTVWRGKWHGSVAIKMFNVAANGLDNKKALEAFKAEVSTFRKTRHENLVLFMGACMKPPQFCIVTSYCKGHSLHSHLYERKEKFNLNRIISIGRQISQGMGYLHARGIVHKDLRSKNIHYDSSNNKVIIADFGFFSLTKLAFSDDKHKDHLKIPKGWLCYLAPELMKALKPSSDDQEQDDLPFSFSTDIFSFGTIWHELIFDHLPFEGQPAEVVIWQVGKGVKQSLINLQASKEIKDILMLCWAYKPNDRPEFSKLVDILTNLPKKRLQRSPSHPTHLMTSRHLY